jgi:hypothetical protein
MGRGFQIRSASLPAHRPAHQVRDENNYYHGKYDDDHVQVVSYLTIQMIQNELKTSVGIYHLQILVSLSNMNFSVL